MKAQGDQSHPRLVADTHKKGGERRGYKEEEEEERRGRIRKRVSNLQEATTRPDSQRLLPWPADGKCWGPFTDPVYTILARKGGGYVGARGNGREMGRRAVGEEEEYVTDCSCGPEYCQCVFSPIAASASQISWFCISKHSILIRVCRISTVEQ